MPTAMTKKTKQSLPQDNSKHQQQIRMDESLKTRIREFQARMRKATGLEVTFASAVRTLIKKGLEVAQ